MRSSVAVCATNCDAVDVKNVSTASPTALSESNMSETLNTLKMRNTRPSFKTRNTFNDARSPSAPPDTRYMPISMTGGADAQKSSKNHDWRYRFAHRRGWRISCESSVKRKPVRKFTVMSYTKQTSTIRSTA